MDPSSHTAQHPRASQGYIPLRKHRGGPRNPNTWNDDDSGIELKQPRVSCHDQSLFQSFQQENSSNFRTREPETLESDSLYRGEHINPNIDKSTKQPAVHIIKLRDTHNR